MKGIMHIWYGLFSVSFLQSNECSHFFQLKNVSFCGYHPKNSKYVQDAKHHLHSGSNQHLLRPNNDWPHLFSNFRVTQREICFKYSTRSFFCIVWSAFSVAGILASLQNTQQTRGLPAMSLCLKTPRNLLQSQWGELDCLSICFYLFILCKEEVCVFTSTVLNQTGGYFWSVRALL